jgi:hypothetical protein
MSAAALQLLGKVVVLFAVFPESSKSGFSPKVFGKRWYENVSWYG